MYANKMISDKVKTFHVISFSKKNHLYFLKLSSCLVKKFLYFFSI